MSKRFKTFKIKRINLQRLTTKDKISHKKRQNSIITEKKISKKIKSTKNETKTKENHHKKQLMVS